MATFPLTEFPQYVSLTQKKTAFGFFSRRNHAAALVLDQTSFLNRLRIEEKRFGRSRSPFMLMLIDVQLLGSDRRAQKTMRKLTEMLNSSVRQTDSVGWYEQHRTIGVLFCEIRSEANSPIIERKMKIALQRRLNSEDLIDLNISFRVFHQEDESDADRALEAASFQQEQRAMVTFA